jgi:hypothetical protein
MDARTSIRSVTGILLLLAVASACVTATDSTSQTTGQSTQAGSSTTAAPSGVSCSFDTNTGSNLCVGTTACPNVLVNTVQFPNCGFRTFAPSFDLECICFGNYLCPVGTVATCQAVSTLLSTTSLTEVCNGVSLDYCKQGAPSVSQGTGGATSACDQTCYSTCVGAPACIVACGC